LILAGAARVVVPDGQLVLESTAVSSTAAELNLLDALSRGSILYGNSSAATTVLTKGSADQVLTSDGTDISWEDASGGGISGLTGLVESNSIWLGADPSGTTDTAEKNVSIGTIALDSITTGDHNTATGYSALGANTTGTGNTALGYATIMSSVDGDYNTAVGFGAFSTSGNDGDYNTAVGWYALGSSDVSGHNNVAIGRQAAYSITSSSSNICIGYTAGGTITTGDSNTCIGQAAGSSITTEGSNTMVGTGAGSNCTGEQNVCVGANISITDGDSNVLIGRNAFGNGTGNYNVGVGAYALGNCNTGATNTTLGASGGYNITSGDHNTCIGNEAGGSGHSGSLTTGDRNVLIGYMVVPSAADGDNQIVIVTDDGAAATRYPGTAGKGDDTGFIDPNQGAMYQGDNTSTWTSTSDERIKKNIVDSTIGLAEINQIQIRNFEYRLPEEVDAELPSSAAIAKEGVQTGVIAQEVMDILPDIIKQETTGAYSVNPDNITWHLVKAVQELTARIEELENN